ncbi:bifunctional 2-polyprenyl-6-hydroxyphenol methylase/3-demethylubiquinol 3-O-methyltransferase UbiG [Ponticaulis sp.]|uniref:class I SAM-dependent methyltransferase n=1 Tax=Ponticaulis sp. TaxID=2020902 RepID=UPI0025D6943C|nr:class I SAM-dependent methyltransferase [Ponticaulis sp.]
MSQGIPKEFWDARFSEEGFAYGARASRLLLSWADLIRKNCRTALVPASGEGRDAVFLASLGLDVTAIDISTAGLAKTQKLADEMNVTVKTVEADLFKWSWPEAGYDLVASMFAHMPSAIRPQLHSVYIKSLAPGGFVFVEGFTKDQISYQEKYQSGGPHDVDMLYAAEDITSDFAALSQQSCMTGVETLSEGSYHTGPAALLRAVYQKTGDMND